MRKAVYITVALIAFTFGISVYYIRPLFVPISLSDLRANILYYKHLEIKVKAKLEVTEENSHYFINLKDWENDCSGDNFCFRGLELSDQLIAENISLIKELIEKNKPVERANSKNDDYRTDGEYYVEVEVTGRLVEKENVYFSGGNFYDIKVKKFEPKSSIKFVSRKEMLEQ